MQLVLQKKTSPKVAEPDIQVAINSIYDELNALKLAVNNDAVSSQSLPSEGNSGDVRLYTKKHDDGTTAHYVQGKFGDNWASGRLGLDKIHPDLADIVQTPFADLSGDGGEYITKEGVNFLNLDFNNSIGHMSNQVPKGDHSHEHTTLLGDLGTHTHPQISEHIDTTTIHYVLADTLLTPSVSLSADVGGDFTAARSDHGHVLNTDQEYIWTKPQEFTPSAGSGDAITANGAVKITGDVDIIGDLSVDYATTGDGNGNATIGGTLDVDGDATLDGNVDLNEVEGSFNYTDTLTTNIRGKTTIYNDTVIQHQPGTGENQLSIKYDNLGYKQLDVSVNSTGMAFLTVADDSAGNKNSLTFDGESIRPQTTLTSDLGHGTKRWRTIYAGELNVEILVAQEVMATIGGRIMVAPTSTLAEGLLYSATQVKVMHNIFETDDIGFMQGAPNGYAQTEAVRFTSEATPTQIPDPIGCTGASSAAIAHFVGGSITKLVTFTAAHNLVHGQWITIQHTDSASSWAGPTSTQNVYQCFIETDPLVLPSPNTNTNLTIYLRLPSSAQATVVASEISITTSPYTYTIVRDANGDSNANSWAEDAAIVNWGHKVGDGFIDLTATQGVYGTSGPHMSLHSRKVTQTGASVSWLVPEIARLGNLNGTGMVGNDQFGLMVGKNLEYPEHHDTYPFSGLLANEQGAKLYNSGIESYTGTARTVYLGKDLRYDASDATTNVLEDKTSLVLGNGITVNPDTNSYTNANFEYAWDIGEDKYVLKLDGAIDIISDTFYDSPEEIFAALPNMSLSENPSTSGLYLTPHYLGFYSGSEWPLVIGSSGTNDGNVTPGSGLNPFAQIGLESGSLGYLKYTVAEGLEIKGKVTITSPTVANTLLQLELENLVFNIPSSVYYTPSFKNYSTTDLFVHIRGTGFNGEHKIQFTTNTQASPQIWTDVGILTNPVIDHPQWHTFHVDVIGSNDYNGFKVLANTVSPTVSPSISGVVVTEYAVGDPESIISSGNQNWTYYQTYSPSSYPPDRQLQAGDSWYNTGEGLGLPLYTFSPEATWEPTFTVIDGGSITTGDINAVNMQSIDTITDYSGAQIPRTRLKTSTPSSLRQYTGEATPQGYTELGAQQLVYKHEKTTSIGVENDSTPYEYKIPKAIQIVRSDELILGTPFVFSENGLTPMWDNDYQIIPINKNTLVTGGQTFQGSGGIDEESLIYTTENKTKLGFTMIATLWRGLVVPYNTSVAPLAGDLLDGLADNTPYYGEQSGYFQGGQYPPPASIRDFIDSNFRNYSFVPAANKYMWFKNTSANTVNSAITGGATKIKILITQDVKNVLWLSPAGDFNLSDTYYPIQGKTYLHYCLRVGLSSNGTSFDDSDNFYVVGPPGVDGVDVETTDCLWGLSNIAPAGSTEYATVKTYGTDYYNSDNQTIPYYTFNNTRSRTIEWEVPFEDGEQLQSFPSLRVELIVFAHQQENLGEYGGMWETKKVYRGPIINAGGGDNNYNDQSKITGLQLGQNPKAVRTVEGSDYVGAIVAAGLNISS